MSEPRTGVDGEHDGLDLDLAGVEVDRDEIAVQQVRARAFGKLFGEQLPAPTIGRFTVLREVGRGGMGVVHAAFDPQLERNVALKVLRRHGRGTDDRGQARLLREARAAARLSHPNVVTVYEVGEDRGAIHIAMELLDAITLRQHTAVLGDDWRAIVMAYVAAGRGLAAAHRAGIVHRDFKPDNVLVVLPSSEHAALRVCVTDFGLAAASLPAGHDDASGTDTATAGVFGTVPYMAPEQLRGQAVTAQADQFSFCVALWEALFGRRPFAGDTVAALAAAIDAGAIEPDDARVPAVVRSRCRTGLAARPSARHPDMDVLLDGLQRAAQPGRRPWIWPVAASTGAAAIAAFAWTLQPEPCTGAADQLAPVWSEARREQLATAMQRTALPYAADVARELDHQLEAYANTWSAAHHEACAATRVRREASEPAMDRAMACLADRLSRFDQALAVLERVEPEVVESALAVSAALPSIATCARADARPGAITLPEAPQARARVQQQLAALEHGAALRRAGRPRESAAALAEVASSADALAHAPLGALVRVEQAETALALADHARATTELDAAIELAGDAHELDVVAQAAVVQAAAAVQQGDPSAARGMIRVAGIAIAVSHDPQHLRARLLRTDSRAAYARGDFARALAAGLDALALVDVEHGERSLDSAEALHVVASAHHGLGEYRAAAEKNAHAREIRESLLGPHHPLVADSWANLGGSQLALGNLDGASECFAAALAIRTDVLGADHPAIADLLLNRGSIASRRGDTAAAQQDFERALAILEGKLGPEHPRVIPALLNLAGVALERGEVDRAAELAERGLALLVATHGESHPSVAIALGHLADVAGRRGEHERAIELLTRALEIRTAALGPTHPQLATTLQSLAEAELAVGRRDDAAGHVERAQVLTTGSAGQRTALQELAARIDAAPARKPSSAPPGPEIRDP